MERNYARGAEQYARSVVAGRTAACTFVRNACRRQLDDLDRWGKKPTKAHPYWFDHKAANRACKFIELLPHTKGKWAAARELIELQRWQCFVVCVLFGWKRRDGKRRFRKAYIEVGRKNAKSTLAAAIGLYMLCADGEFGAEIYSGATTEKQAWEVFRPARLMALRTPALRDHFEIDVNAASLVIENAGSRFEPLIGDPGDGSMPSCAIVDEYHEHTTPRLYDTMETGMGSREQPLLIVITTAGGDLSSPCYSERRHVIQVLAGRIQDEEYFGLIYTIDEDDDWTSIEAVKKANPNFGVSVFEDFLVSKLEQAKRSAARQNAFKTKHLNLWIGAREAWMDMRAWGKCERSAPLEDLQGRPCYIALDLASKVDVAAKIYLFPPDGDDDRLWQVHRRFYLPEDRVTEAATGNAAHYDAWAKEGLIELTPGNVIDFDVIEEELREDASRFQAIEVPYDPWQATQLAVRLSGEGVPMVEMPATVKNFSEPMKALEAMVLQAVSRRPSRNKDRLAHPHCPVLDWMMSNVVATLDAKENIYPRKETEEAKIDGPVALIMALGRGLAGESSSVYEERGILTL